MDIQFVTGVLDISGVVVADIVDRTHAPRRPVLGRDMGDADIALLTIVVVCCHTKKEIR